MIKDMRVVEWTEGRGWRKRFRWDIQIKRVGSTKWEPLPFVKLTRRPKKIARELA
jgi:hypothetical protein